MAKHRFSRLTSPESTARLAEWADDMDYESTVTCPINSGHQRAGKRLPNLSVTLPGKTVEDIVWTWQSECLLTDRVLELFRSSGFTGFEVKPVKTRFKRSEEPPPRLWELVVTGWAGMASAESGIELVRHCDACLSSCYSGCSKPEKIIDDSRWDGSDFFIVWPLPKFVFVTDRVAHIILENRLDGVILEQPKHLSLGGGFSPGRLSCWMPESRARELGETAGIKEI